MGLEVLRKEASMAMLLREKPGESKKMRKATDASVGRDARHPVLGEAERRRILGGVADERRRLDLGRRHAHHHGHRRRLRRRSVVRRRRRQLEAVALVLLLKETKKKRPSTSLYRCCRARSQTWGS